MRERNAFTDGQYTVCLDKLLPTSAPLGCLVYSFGVSDDWEFDDWMAAHGCDVYSFDPSIKTESYRRSVSHWFYNWGLGTGNANNWTLFTIDQIREKLGHVGRKVR